MDGIALDVVHGRSRARDDGFVEATSVDKRAERGRRGDEEEKKRGRRMLYYRRVSGVVSLDSCD